MTIFIICDWAGNLMDFGKFKTFDDAEAYLANMLGDHYDLEREEFVIIERKK